MESIIKYIAIYQWISNWLTKQTQRDMSMGVHLTIYVPLISGVPQGTVLGPLMFLLCINDINKNITSSKLGLFADDCVIYRTIYNKDDSIALQNDLSALSDWARIWQMNFNVDKCILLRFTRSHSSIINEYFLNNQVILYKDVYKYLEIANTLSWNILL